MRFVMKIEMSGYACVRADARTVKDLRTLLRFLDDNKVIDSAELDWGSGHLYVSVIEDAKAEFIQCGDHIPPDLEFDVILNTHDHDDDEDEQILCSRCNSKDDDNTYHLHHGKYFCAPCYRKQAPETYEEALEMQLDYPAQYDWPARDRSKGKGK